MSGGFLFVWAGVFFGGGCCCCWEGVLVLVVVVFNDKACKTKMDGNFYLCVTIYQNAKG